MPIWTYYNFNKDFIKDVENIKKQIKGILPLISHLPYKEALLITKIESSKLYKCVENSLDLFYNKGVVFYDPNSLFFNPDLIQYFKDYYELFLELNDLEFPKEVYTYEPMSPSLKTEFENNRQRMINENQDRLNLINNEEGIISKFISTGKEWLRI